MKKIVLFLIVLLIVGGVYWYFQSRGIADGGPFVPPGKELTPPALPE